MSTYTTRKATHKAKAETLRRKHARVAKYQFGATL